MKQLAPILLTATACVAHAPANAPPEPLPIAVCARATLATRLPPPAVATPPNRCLPDGIPPTPEPADRQDGCISTPASRAPLERAAASTLRQRFERTVDGSTIDVHFDCDPLGPEPVTRIVFEEGSGHGQSLVVWTLSRAESPARFDARGFSYQGFTHGPLVHVAAATIPAADIDARLDRIRAALTASVREVEPPPTPGSLGLSGRGASSSNDFHVLVRLDTAYSTLERHFTGYQSSFEQGRYLAVQLAAESLRPLLGRAAFTETPEGDDRNVFVQRFVDAEARFGDASAWWVREHYVDLAATLGTRALVPSLVRMLDPRASDASAVRTRDAALAAVASITGWDSRRVGRGRTRPVEDVAREVFEECTRGILPAPAGPRPLFETIFSRPP